MENAHSLGAQVAAEAVLDDPAATDALRDAANTCDDQTILDLLRGSTAESTVGAWTAMAHDTPDIHGALKEALQAVTSRDAGLALITVATLLLEDGAVSALDALADNDDQGLAGFAGAALEHLDAGAPDGIVRDRDRAKLQAMMDIAYSITPA